MAGTGGHHGHVCSFVMKPEETVQTDSETGGMMRRCPRQGRAGGGMSGPTHGKRESEVNVARGCSAPESAGGSGGPAAVLELEASWKPITKATVNWEHRRRAAGLQRGLQGVNHQTTGCRMPSLEASRKPLPSLGGN